MDKFKNIILIIGIFLLLAAPAHAIPYDLNHMTNFDYYSTYEWGYSNWQDNQFVRDAWFNATGETSPDYYENFETGFNSGQNISGLTFGGGAKFYNVNGTAAVLAGGGRKLGGSPAIGALSWSNSSFSNTSYSKIDFVTPADYLGFYIFDTDHGGTTVKYNVGFTDGTSSSVSGNRAGQNKYVFVGLVNTHPYAQFDSVSVETRSASYYGIDELEWGKTPSAPIPEPGTLLLLGSGLTGLAASRKKFRK